MQSKYFTLFLCLSLAAWCVTVNAEPPARCLQPHPTGYGLCAMLLFGYYYNPATSQCEEWSEGGCGTTGGHSYANLEDCQADCMGV